MNPGVIAHVQRRRGGATLGGSLAPSTDEIIGPDLCGSSFKRRLQRRLQLTASLGDLGEVEQGTGALLLILLNLCVDRFRLAGSAAARSSVFVKNTCYGHESCQDAERH